MKPLDEKALEAGAKLCATFFRHWWNVPGGNTDEGARDWVQSPEGQSAIRAYMAALDPAPGWMPIETAPKWRGTGVPPYVLVSNGHHVGVGYRMEPSYPDDPEFVDESGAFIEPQPTHWQPLLAAPMSQEG